MLISNFKEEILKYRTGDHSEFRRINLVYAFQDIVNNLHTKDDISPEILQTMDLLVQLHTVDPQLFSNISSDLLEPTIRLQILLAPKLAKALTQLSITIATHSKALEFQNELGNIIKLLKSPENLHPFEQFKHKQGEESKDSFKTVITFYVPIILRMVEDCEVQFSMGKMMEVVEFIRSEVREYNAVLGTDIIHEICSVLIEKKGVIIQYAQKETLRFLVEMLDVYLLIGIFKQYRKEIVSTISEIFGDFWKIALRVNKNKEVDVNKSFGALSALAVKSIKGRDLKLSLPTPLSQRSRCLIFIPTGLMTENPVHQKRILQFCNFYCDSEIDPYKLTSYYPQLSPNQVVIYALEHMNYTETDRKRVKAMHRNVFHKFSIPQRFRFIPNIISKLSNEVIINFLLRILVNSDTSGFYMSKMLKISVLLKPVIEYVICFDTLSKYLSSFQSVQVSDSVLISELKELYEELVNKLNIEDDKRKSIIEQFKRLIEC